MTRAVITMTIDDAAHFSDAQKASIIESYLPHEREARTKGIPMFGRGRAFPIAEEVYRYEATPLPKHWYRICGIDFGYDHPFGAAWLAWDRDADCIYVYDCYRVREQTPILHAPAIKSRGAKIPVAWPHDGLQHDKGSGEQLAQQYRNQGVAMLPERAQFPDERGNGVEAGVTEMLDRMQTGRLKIAAHLSELWEEIRLYHRAPPAHGIGEAKLVKMNDDLICAVRYGMMMLRYAKTESPAKERYRGNGNGHGSAWAA
jgi:hypothetical protein